VATEWLQPIGQPQFSRFMWKMTVMRVAHTSEDVAAPPTLTPREAAARLDVSDDTVRRWMKSGQLDGVRVGGRLRVPVTAVLSFARPANEPTPEADAGEGV
jgi:excisionase family DNA binding protein